MNAMLDKLMSLKGQIATITTTRPMKTRKGVAPITKTSKFQCRVGVNYDNIARVQDKRANGELPAENAGLPWGHWVEFPYVIEHKGELYFRCTALKNQFRPQTQFTQFNDPISAEQAKSMCLASEFKSSDAEVFNVKLSSIIDVA